MVQTEWKMNALMIVVVLPLVASAATLAEFKGLKVPGTCGRVRVVEFGGFVMVDPSVRWLRVRLQGVQRDIYAAPMR